MRRPKATESSIGVAPTISSSTTLDSMLFHHTCKVVRTKEMYGRTTTIQTITTPRIQIGLCLAIISTPPVAEWIFGKGTRVPALSPTKSTGTHNLTTIFRNIYVGNQPSCYGVICGQEVYAVQLQYVNRYFNIVGNVLGQSGIQIVYDDNPATVSSPGGNISKAIYAVGWAGQNGTYSSEVAPTNDMLSVTSLMRWGNYDAVNAAVRWNSLEVPSNLTDTTGSPSRYANPVPANQTLPNSFYSPSQPSWWATPYGTPPWPAVGPDVTGGNIPGVGGHANNIPAELCYANTPIDPAYQHSYAVNAATWSSGTVTLVAAMGWFSHPGGNYGLWRQPCRLQWHFSDYLIHWGQRQLRARIESGDLRLGWFRPLSQYPALQWLLDRKFELGTSAPTADGRCCNCELRFVES